MQNQENLVFLLDLCQLFLQLGRIPALFLSHIYYCTHNLSTY